MQKAISLLCVLCLSVFCLGQNLSDEGRGHFKAAMALFEIASSNDDYKQVAQEFEAVTKSDPEYADTYLNLCKIYGRLGTDGGEVYFKKAQEALENYHRLAPEDVNTYNDEKMVLDALQMKYKNSPTRYVGKWKFKNGALSTWYIDIQYNMGEYSIILNKEYMGNKDYKVIKIDQYTYDIIEEIIDTKNSTYYGNCDSDADPGYPTGGKYYYNYSKCEFYDRITLKNDAPFHTFMYKIHHEFFLNGLKTYSETGTSGMEITEQALVRY